MTLRAVLLLSLLMFSLGWLGGLRYARETAADGPAPARSAATSAGPGVAAATVALPPASTIAERAVTAAGASPASAPASASAQPSSNITLDPASLEVIRKMTEQAVQLQVSEFPAQMRSEPWASDREAKLRATIEPMLANFVGARLVKAECRTTLCQMEAEVPSWATELTEARAEPGSLNRALRDAGFEVTLSTMAPDSAQPLVRLTYTMRTAQDSAPAPRKGT